MATCRFCLLCVFDAWCISSEPEYLDAYRRQHQHGQQQQQQGTGHVEHPIRYLRLSHAVKHPGLVRNAGVCVLCTHRHSQTPKHLTCVHSCCTNQHNSAGTTAGGNGLHFLTMMTNGLATSSNSRSVCVCGSIIETTASVILVPVGRCHGLKRVDGLH